mgnify:FL=1
MACPNSIDHEDVENIVSSVILPLLVAYRDRLAEDVPELNGVISILRLLENRRVGE